VGNWQFGLHSSDHVRHRCGGGGQATSPTTAISTLLLGAAQAAIH